MLLKGQRLEVMLGVRGQGAALRAIQFPTPRPPASTLTPWATTNSKFPDLIIDKDEEAEGHGDQPPLEPEGQVRGSRIKAVPRSVSVSPSLCQNLTAPHRMGMKLKMLGIPGQ